jgi:predicted small lipoprotein YifL
MIRTIAVALAVLALAGCGASTAGPAANQTARARSPAAAVQKRR